MKDSKIERHHEGLPAGRQQQLSECLLIAANADRVEQLLLAECVEIKLNSNRGELPIELPFGKRQAELTSCRSGWPAT